MVFRCASETLVTDMTSVLAIPSVAKNLIAADFIVLSPFCVCPTRTCPIRTRQVRRSHVAQIGAPEVLITCRVSNGLFALCEQ